MFKQVGPPLSKDEAIINVINKINSQVDFAVDIVKKAEKYDSDIVKVAFLKASGERWSHMFEQLKAYL